MVLKPTDTASPLMAFTRKGPCSDTVHVTPVKHSVTAAAVEPLTPTANLKMLISAASPDIRDREMKKVLFRPIENEGPKPASPETPTEDEEKDDSCQVRETKRPYVFSIQLFSTYLQLMLLCVFTKYKNVCQVKPLSPSS